MEHDVHLAPIRHHSPACARALGRMIADLAPAAILIEAPDDCQPLSALLADPATQPPVAFVSVLEGRGASWFPLCAHSPEYVAAVAGARAGIPVRFIDLPASDKAMRDGPARADEPFAPTGPDERAFDSNDYVRALCERIGCRDGAELWDHLFETRLADPDWRRFFADVGQYCAHLREADHPARLAADGTLAREARMVAHLAATRRQVAGPIIVVVGGFHASAIRAALPGLDAVAAPPRPEGRAPHLVRYGYRQLNALTGYGAGLPLPGYYAALWEQAGPEPFGAAADALLAGFAQHLRKALPDHAPSVPVLVNALEAMHRLAALRGRPGPGRDDLLDACRSAFGKGEAAGDGIPVMAELADFLTGSAIGSVPPGTGAPPLVEAVRARARALGFRLDDGERRHRALDLYRKPRHREASRFLHACAFLDLALAERTAGPDFRTQVDLDRLHEHWTVTWSPIFEARLIERSGDGDTLEAALAAELARRIVALEAQGLAGDATAAIDLFAAATRAGLGKGAAAVLPLIEAAVVRDADLANVAAALGALVALWRARDGYGLGEATPLAALIAAGWRRALFLLPDLVHAGEVRVAPLLTAIVTLREVAELGAAVPGIDAGLFGEGVAALLDAPLRPALAGAVAAVALLAGRLDGADLARRMTGELGGAHPDPAARVAWLRGVLTVSRELLWRVPALVDGVDALFARLDGDAFLTLLAPLRLAFGALDPREIDRLARDVGVRHGADAAALTAPIDLTEATVAANRETDRLLAATLAADGLL